MFEIGTSLLLPAAGAIVQKEGNILAKLSEKYELMIVFDPTAGEEAVTGLIDRIRGLIEKNATLDSFEDLGKKRLAYEINYKTEGHYVLMLFTSAPDVPKELDRVIGITDGILRSLITVRPA